jgi:hypothetical protein
VIGRVNRAALPEGWQSGGKSARLEETDVYVHPSRAVVLRLALKLIVRPHELKSACEG